MFRKNCFLLVLLLLGLQNFSTKALPSPVDQGNPLEDEQPSLMGSWNFFGFIYRETEMPPINPRLKIQFFFEEAQNRLKYFREDEQGFCERVANYEIQNCRPADSESRMENLPKDAENPEGFIECMMYQKVTQTHPDNRGDCQTDSDMRLGTESWSPIQFNSKEFRLWAPLGDEGIIFRFHII